MKSRKFIALCSLLTLICSCSGNSQTSTPTTDSSATTATGEKDKTSSTTKKLTGKEKYAYAHDKTLNSSSYQYDYELNASISFKAAGVNASAQVASLSGTTYYNANNKETQYLQKKVAKAGLLLESTSYTYNSGTELIKVNENSNRYSIEEKKNVTNFDYKNYSFNKLINNITSEQLDDGKDLAENKYQLNYKVNYKLSTFINIAGSIDVDYFLKVVNTYQNYVELTYDSYVTYNGDYFDTYYVNFNVEVKDIATISLTYTQKYSNVGKDISFSLPSLGNQHISKTDIDTDLTEIKESISTFKAKTSSSYDYKVKTTVDHGPSKSNPLGCAVNSTSKGDAKRGLLNDKVYFNNDLEVDSDYKNKDQYTSDCVKDYHVYRAKLNDGSDSVRDEVVKTLKNSFTDATDSTSLDDYYFFYEDFLSSDYIGVSSKEEYSEKNEIVYTLGLNNSGSKKILCDYNASIRINGSHEVDEDKNPGHIDVYQIEDNFSSKKSEVKITLDKTSKEIKSITTNIKGYYEAIDSSVKSEGANTFVKFQLESTLDNFDTTTTYEIPTKDKDIR